MKKLILSIIIFIPSLSLADANPLLEIGDDQFIRFIGGSGLRYAKCIHFLNGDVKKFALKKLETVRFFYKKDTEIQKKKFVKSYLTHYQNECWQMANMLRHQARFGSKDLSNKQSKLILSMSTDQIEQFLHDKKVIQRFEKLIPEEDRYVSTLDLFEIL